MTSIITNPNEGPNGGIEGKVVENDNMKTASSSCAAKGEVQEPLKVDDYVDSIEDATRQELMDVAAEIVRSKCASTEAKSQAIDSNAELKIRKVDMQRIVLGHILGRGGFCIVSEVDKIFMQRRTAKNGSKQRWANRGAFFRPRGTTRTKDTKLQNVATSDCGSLSEFHSVCDSDFAHAIEPSNSRNEKGAKKKSRRGRYVVKQVNPDLARFDKIAYLKGCVDLATEFQFLASLDHPNIILLGGVSTEGPCDFLVLQMMNETLTKRFKTWMDTDRRCKGITGFFFGSKKLVQDLYQERIKVAYDIACGVKYLHEKHIVFRDLVSH